MNLIADTSERDIVDIIKYQIPKAGRVFQFSSEFSLNHWPLSNKETSSVRVRGTGERGEGELV